MTQRFKLYDKKYSSLKNTIFENENLDKQQLNNTSKWIYADQIVFWTQKQIAFAVYESESADQWQQFRVSLKGNLVRMKIHRLQKRYEEINLHNIYKGIVENIGKLGIHYKHELDNELVLEKIRIDNYIGALCRQRSLDENYNIVKEI